MNTRCSETFRHKTALVSILGIPIYYNINTPRSVIQPSVMPGECWAFEVSKVEPSLWLCKLSLAVSLPGYGTTYSKH